jgi:hypothetical protein
MQCQYIWVSDYGFLDYDTVYLLVDTSVSEEHAAPFFKAELSRMNMLSECYMKQVTILGQGREDWVQSRPIRRYYRKMALSFSVVYVQTDHYFEKTGSFPSTAEFLQSSVQ